MAGVGFRMVTWLSSFYLFLRTICRWHITGLSIKLIITIRPLLQLGLNVLTGRNFVTLRFKMILQTRKLYYTCAFYRPSYSGQAVKQNGRAQRNCYIWKGKKP